MKEEFIPVNSYKGKDAKDYKRKKYFSLKPKELHFIEENLDWEIEKKIGYFPKKKP